MNKMTAKWKLATGVVVVLAVLITIYVSSMMYYVVIRVIFAFLVACYLSYRGLKKRSLSTSGAIAAWFAGFVTGVSGYRFMFTLITFYLSSSKLTKLGFKVKLEVEDGYKGGEGNRDFVQVFCSSLSAVFASLYYIGIVGFDDHVVDFHESMIASSIICFVVGFYGACNGDTWASEIGILNKQKPRYILNLMKTVPHGTNGGVTTTGTIASAAGGLLIGIVAYIVGLFTTGSIVRTVYILLCVV